MNTGQEKTEKLKLRKKPFLTSEGEMTGATLNFFVMFSVANCHQMCYI